MAKFVPFVHKDATISDSDLAAEAETHFGLTPALQFVAELLTALREGEFPWWTPEKRRAQFSATVRMEAFAQRRDIRQRIVVDLKAMLPKAAYDKSPEDQAKILDEYLDSRDINVGDFENAFSTRELVIYGDARELYNQFKRSMPSSYDPATAGAQKALLAKILTSLLTERNISGGKTKPILSAWDVMDGIDVLAWHTKLPSEVRVAAHKAWLKKGKEHPREPFNATDILTVATPELLTTNLDFESFVGVFLAAERVMGFEQEEPKTPAVENLSPKA